MPVLASDFVHELELVAPGDFEALPVIIEGAEKCHSIINVLHKIRCLDESRSTIVRWPFRPWAPDMDGAYLTVSDLHIDREPVGTAQMFRIERWPLPLIVSERVAAVLADATGMGLEAV